jgi:hypothetical protein
MGTERIGIVARGSILGFPFARIGREIHDPGHCLLNRTRFAHVLPWNGMVYVGFTKFLFPELKINFDILGRFLPHNDNIFLSCICLPSWNHAFWMDGPRALSSILFEYRFDRQSRAAIPNNPRLFNSKRQRLGCPERPK